ncbi:MAG: Gfo/Idh/MocA family oxidoreductase [Candidatus Izemoplasmataceae bacterium]
MIHTAIIGFGMSGKTIHFPILHAHESFKVTHVMSSNKKTKPYLLDKGSDALVVEDFQEVLSDPSVDLLVISVPNHLHYEFVKRAIEAGKHAIVEKPFVKTHKEAKALFELAKKKKTVLRVFHNRKYDGDFMTVKALIEQGTLQDVFYMSARFDRLRVAPKEGWRTEEGVMSGVFYDLGPHLFHYAVSLFGLPRSVYCDLITDHEGLKTDDHFEATLYYDGLRVSLGSEQFARYALPKFHLKGRNASYVKLGFDIPEFVEYPMPADYQGGLFSKIYANESSIGKDVPVLTGAHYRFYDDLSDAIHHGRLTDEDTRISLAVIQAMEAAVQSHEEKRRIELETIS